MKTFVVEPQLLFVDFLRGVLESAGFTTASVWPAIDLEAIAREQPEAVFVDLDFTGVVIREAIAAVRGVAQRASICLFTLAPSREDTRAYLEAGAACVIRKDASEGAVVDALRAVALAASAEESDPQDLPARDSAGS